MSSTVDGLDDNNNNNNISGPLVVNGDITASGDVKSATVHTGDVNSATLHLRSLGGFSSALNYYEEYSGSLTFTGCGQTTSAVGIQLTRIGRVVTLSVENISFTAVSAGLLSSGVFPARFNSSGFTGNQHFPILVSNGVQQYADAFVNGSNRIIITANGAGGNFAAGFSIVFKFATSWTY